MGLWWKMLRLRSLLEQAKADAKAILRRQEKLMSTMADALGLANDIASKIDAVVAKGQAPVATQADVDTLTATLKVVDDKVNAALAPPVA
jgi:hypothetical protein